MEIERRERSTGLVARMVGAARLDPQVFEEVEADPNATFQAVVVVILVGLATGIGNLTLADFDLLDLIVGIIGGVAQWALWAMITYFIGTSALFREPQTQANWGQLARTLGFAQSPGVLRVFGFIPVIGPVIFFMTFLWQLATMVVAVRQALDYQSIWRAVGVVVVGFIIVAIVTAIVFAVARD